MADDGLPPVAITDWQSYQSDQFGQSTDAMLATLNKPIAPPVVADNADRAAPPTPPASVLPDLAPVQPPPADASAGPPRLNAAQTPPPSAPAPAAVPAFPPPVTPSSPLATDDLSPVLNAASAAGVDPAVFLAAHQSGHVDSSNFFDQATQLAQHIADKGGDLVQGLAAFTGSAANAAKVLDKAVANLNPTPSAATTSSTGSSTPQGAVTQTTAEMSGGGKAVPLGDAAHVIMGAAADSASWLGEQGQKALQAVLVTEGGMTGARGDSGNSAGPLQFYSGGQLANFAQQHGMTQDAAKTYVEAHPTEAVAWAIGTPDHPGYLGSALAAGLAKGLSGPDLATYAQQHGQVSVSPERAGQNWNALFGSGNGPVSIPASTSSGPPVVADAGDRAQASKLSQFGDKQLSTDEAYAACGPAAAVRFAQAEGRNPTLREATDLAKTVGWTSASGMAGLSSEKALMDKLNIPTKVVQGAAWDAFAREAQTGNPVTISTAGHYFYADGFNPDTGAFHVGQSGLDLKGGSEWMTPAQMVARMGAVQGGLLADNPTVPNSSTVKGVNQPADRQDRIDASAASPTAPVTAPLVPPTTTVNQTPSQDQNGSTGNSTLDWLGRQKDAIASTIGDAANAVGNALPTFNPTLDPNSPVAQQAAGNPQNPLAVKDQAVSGLADTLVPPGTPVLSGAAHMALDPANLAFGPVGYAANAGSGIAQNVTQQLGGDQTAQTVAGLAGGLVGGVAPAAAERAAGPLVGKGLEALDALSPPNVAFASSLSGPQQALSDARQAVADLAAKFPQMSPGSLAASAPGKQLAALEADAAANPAKYAALIPNAPRALASAADTAAATEGLPTRAARLGANDVNAGAEAPIGNEPFTRDPQGNIVATPAPQDANATLRGLINQAKAKGFDTTALEAQLPTPAVSSDASIPEYQRISQQSVADVRAQHADKLAAQAAADAPPAVQFDAEGNPVSAGPKQVAPVTLDQVAPQGPLSRVTQVVNSAFQPIENLPAGDVKDALKRYAAVVGSQSQGARVVGDTAAHQIAESGPMLTAEGFPIDSGAAMQSNVIAKARADLNGVLQRNGLSENTPEVKAILDNIRNPSAIRSNPLGKVVLGVNTGVKGSLFGLSNMHNYTEAVTAAASGGPEAVSNYARAFLSPSFFDGIRYGTLAPDFNRAAMAGVTGLLHNGAGGSDAEQIATVATRAVIGAIGGAGAGYEESLRAGDTRNALRNALLGGVAGAGAGVAAPALFGSMFGRAVPLAKVTVFKQLTAGGMDELQAAAAVNRSFGGLNYAQMGRSKTLQDAFRLIATAPDWNEATVRQIGSAVTGKDSGYSAKMLAKAVGGSMIASEILSYVLNGHSTANNEPGHQLEVQIGTDKNGKGIYMGFMPGNVQAYGNLIDKIAGAPAATATDLGFFGTGCLGVLPQLGIDAATGSEYIGGPKTKNAVASAVERAAPIGISSVAQGLERGASWQDLAASILAGPNLRYGSKALAATAKTPTPSAPAPAIGRYAPRSKP